MSLLEVIVNLNESLPKPGQADYKLVGKFINFKTAVPLDKEVQDFDPAEYVKNLTLPTVDMKKLQKGIQDFLKDVPKQTSIPQWLSSLKEVFKAPSQHRSLTATRAAATCGWPLEDVLAVEEKLNVTVPEGAQVEATTNLLAMIPKHVADHYRIPPATFTIETDLACIEIRENIGVAIELIRIAYRKCQGRDGSALAALSANEAVGTDVESEYALPAEESDATPADAGAPDSETRATDAEGTNLLSIGDVVNCTATKFKDQWDKRKATITKVNKSHYKVQMLEGPSQGVLHKYAFKDCSLVVPAATGAASIAASSADSGVASAVLATSPVAATIDETGAATMPPSQQQALAVTPNRIDSEWANFDFVQG